MNATTQNAPFSAKPIGCRLFLAEPFATSLTALWQADAVYSIALNTPENPEVSVFKLAGADVASYLQRRTSNDVLALAIGEGQANSFLDKKAYVQAVFSLHRAEETTFYALVPTALAAEFDREVNRFKIMEQFSCVNETDQWQIVAEFGTTAVNSTEKKANTIATTAEGGYKITAPFWVFGSQGMLLNATVSFTPKNKPLLAHPSAKTVDLPEVTEKGLVGWDNEARRFRRNLSLCGTELGRLPLVNNRMLIPLESFRVSGKYRSNKISTPNRLFSVSSSTFKALQILWGVPHWGVDLTHETQLPETGLEHWTVSYTKGCFLGQETVARVRTYGGVQQTLMGVKIKPENQSDPSFNAFLTAPTQSSAWQLFHEEKRVAEITSGVLDQATQTLYGLAYLNRAFRLPGVQTQSFILKNSENQTLSVCLEITLLPFTEGFPPQSQANETANTPSQNQQAQRLHEVAMSHFVENRTEEALLVLNQLLENNPNFLEAHETKGVLLSRLGRYEEAIATMHQLLEKNDKHVMAYTNLSVFWLKLNDKDQAEHYKAKATSVAMGLKMAEAMAKKAALQKQTATPEVPSVSAVTEAEALANHKKKLEEKITLFQHALQFAPTDALAHYGLGTTYLELHQLEAAAAAFEQAVAYNPKHSQAYLQWAETLFALQQFQPVADVLAKGIPVASTRGDLQPLAQMKTLQEKTTPFL